MTATIGPDGFCTRCQLVADWCECPPLPDPDTSAAPSKRRARKGTSPAAAPAPASASVDPLPDEPKTELGYARRLIAVYGDRLRYVPAWRRWLVWDGKRWAHDTTGQAPAG